MEAYSETMNDLAFKLQDNLYLIQLYIQLIVQIAFHGKNNLV